MNPINIVAALVPLLLWLLAAAMLGIIFELLRGGVKEVPQYPRPTLGYCVDCQCTQRLNQHGACHRCGSDSILHRAPRRLPRRGKPGILDSRVPPVL